MVENGTRCAVVAEGAEESMNILYHFRTQGTGAEGVHIAGVANAFEQLGHHVTFSSPTGVDPRTSAGANPFTSRKRGLLSRLAARLPGILFELLEIAYNVPAFFRNWRLLAGTGAGLLYERHAFFLFSTALLARWRGLPFVVEVNELVGDERVRPDPWLSFLARISDRLTFRLATLVVVVSPHLQRRIVALRVPLERVLVLPNAVAEESLDAPADGAEVRERLGLTNAVVIGFVGWFVPWHRLDNLVAQFAALAPTHPELRLLLLGDGKLRDTLVDQARRLGVCERIIFTGAVSHDEVPAYLGAMDIAVVPHSNAYRSPIKLFEFMARACAVVAPRVEPVEMVIRHEENGLLFDPKSHTDMRMQLARLACDPELRARLGEQAREDVREHHTWRCNAEAVLANAIPD